MLERTTSCLDPVALGLFRRVEGPVKSSRLLDRNFWRNQGDNIHVPPWWPAYLDKFRDRLFPTSSERPGFRPLHGISSSFDHQDVSRLDSPRAFELPISVESYHSRRFSTRNATRQAILERKRGLDNGISQVDNVGIESGRPALADGSIRKRRLFQSSDAEASPSRHEDGRTTPTRLSLENTLKEILKTNQYSRSNEAWMIFISTQISPPLKMQLLAFLCSSRNRADLQRALSVYQSLDQDKRSGTTYLAAVKAAVRLRAHSQANAINREALACGLGFDSSKYLLNYFVKHELWNSAARTWADLRYWHGKLDSVANSKRAEQTSSSLLSCWADIDKSKWLPAKLLKLARGLESNSPVLRYDVINVNELAKTLFCRVVCSETIMRLITGYGLMSLFATFNTLSQLNPKHYFSALHTLRRISSTKNRSQLAVTVYRNLRFKFPKHRIPRSVFGSMISICTEADLPASTFNVLLQDFAKQYGKPDKAAYQRAMTACGRQGDVQAVKKLFERFLLDHGLQTDLAYLTPLLLAHATIGDVNGTKQQFDLLSSKFGVQPDISCWNILLKAYARSGDVQGAFDLFQIMLKQSLTPDRYTFVTLMGMCSNIGDSEALHYLVDLARHYQVSGSNAMIDTLVHSFCLNDETSKAERLVEHVSTVNRAESPTRMWNILLRHYAHRGNSNSLLRIQRRMRELSVKPDSMTYAALMTALVVLGRTSDAAKLLRSLHFKQNLDTTLFHYSIVLRGFAQEGNRDMVAIIYNEMRERFPRLSPSARLSMIQMQAKRDVSNYKFQASRKGFTSRFRSPHALDALDRTLLETSAADLSSKDPQPGFHRSNSPAVVPSIYVEFLLATYNALGQHQEAEALLARCKSLMKISHPLTHETARQYMNILTLQLATCYGKAQWVKVDQIWIEIFTFASSISRPLQARLQRTFQKDPNLDKLPNNSPFLASAHSNNIGSGSTRGDRKQVLHARRYILSIPLSRYMQALSAQGRTGEVIDLVARLQPLGFELTSKNWNTYMQVLVTSQDPDHQVLAFSLFEEKMVMNAAPIRLLARSKWAEPSTLKAGQLTSEAPLMQRSQVERLWPDKIIPTYFTAVYLALGLTKFFRRTQSGSVPDFEYIKRRAPRTIAWLQKLPYLKDRVQGVLLRGREIRGDPVKRPRAPEKPDLAGILGSESHLDHVPPESLDDLRRYVAAFGERIGGLEGRKIIDAGNTPPSAGDNAWELREKIVEPLFKSKAALMSRSRVETADEQQRRISLEEARISSILDEIIGEVGKERIVSDDIIGDPAVNGVSAWSSTKGKTYTSPSREPLMDAFTDQTSVKAVENETHDFALRETGAELLRGPSLTKPGPNVDEKFPQRGKRRYVSGKASYFTLHLDPAKNRKPVYRGPSIETSPTELIRFRPRRILTNRVAKSSPRLRMREKSLRLMRRQARVLKTRVKAELKMRARREKNYKNLEKLRAKRRANAAKGKEQKRIKRQRVAALRSSDEV